MNCKEMQIWNNAAFDNGGGSDETLLLVGSVHHSSKENQSPNWNTSSGLAKTPVLGKENDLDLEIERVEKEINRLSIRLESLRLEKARRSLKVAEKRGRVVAAKFKEPPKQSIKTESIKTEEGKVDEFKTPRRGVSVGPMEIMRGARRGASLGPNEIYSGSKLKGTPMGGTTLNRRKSCYWKLDGIDELRATKERGKSLIHSPNSRSKMGLKLEVVSTSMVRKTVKKEEGVVQPKKLFVNEGERSAPGPGKKPLKNGRVVPSRYNKVSSGGSLGNKEIRKRSLNGDGDDESKRVKKKWEIPSEDECKASLSVSNMLDKVPKIKTLRVMNESPRDSGAAKRVSELVGRKSFFHFDDESEGEVNGNESFKCSKSRLLECVDESPTTLQLVGNKSFFDHDDDVDMPVFSFEEED